MLELFVIILIKAVVRAEPPSILMLTKSDIKCPGVTRLTVAVNMAAEISSRAVAIRF